MKKVIIQGVKGSFHDIAAQSYYADEQFELVPADSFASLFDQFHSDSTIDSAVMAIENTIAGSIMYNYSLLKDSDFHITGEIFLRIKQQLLVLPGTNLEEITEVHSHPMALAQCKNFLRQYRNWKLIEREDTALCAEEIAASGSKRIAAIASSLAGNVYGLHIAAEGIETNKRNFTRFLILSRKNKSAIASDTAEKASVCFSLKHETGSLSEVLGDLAARSCNLTKIQSVPIIGKEWQYYFFADFILENNAFHEVSKLLEDKVASLHILGHYMKGNYYDS